MKMNSGAVKFVCGLIVGVVGVPILTSKTVKKGIPYVMAGALLARDRVLEDAEKVQAAASDMMADASEIKEKMRSKIENETEEFAEEA